MADEKTITELICYANAGYCLFKLNGKIPATKGADWTRSDYVFPEDIKEQFGGWNGNFGVVLGKKDLVIDIDPRNFKTMPSGEKDKPHVRLFQDVGVDIKTLGAVARTGGGGIHIYLRLKDSVKIKKKNKNYPGIDFLSAGSYVVGVGSKHPETGKNYEWAAGVPLKKAQCAPDSLVSIIKDYGPEVVASQLPALPNGISDNDPSVILQYADYLSQRAPIATQGDNGDHTTFTVACKGRDLGLSQGTTFRIMLEKYNARCLPPWTPEQLATKIRNAYEYATGKVGGDLAIADFEKLAVEEKHPLYKGWDVQANGKKAKTINNTINFLVTPDNPFMGLLAYDEFNAQVKVLGRLPWSREDVRPGGNEWTESDSTQFMAWLSRERFYNVDINTVDRAVFVVAQHTILHPVKDYLRALRWDGTPRIDTFLCEYAGAEDNRFVREASKKFLLQAVSRIYHPGCKADHIIVLEGEQGVGKSSLVEILGGPWYGDIVIDPHSRDTIDAMIGKWFIEFSEMEAHSRSDAQAMKAFITRRVDRVRLAYARKSIDLPRQCVFMGTMNPDATGEYLSDNTGNRRIWPIMIGKVKFKEFAAVRDQLFAEAVAKLESGETTHIDDSEVIDMAVSAQRQRLTTDPWDMVISEYIHEHKLDFVTTKDVWVYALKGSESTLHTGHQRRIAQALKNLGMVPVIKKEEGSERLFRGFTKRELAK